MEQNQPNEQEVVEPHEDPVDESDGDSANGDPNDNVQNDFLHQTSSESELPTSSRESASSDGEETPPQFDQQLPSRHIYLGEGMEELTGRVLVEEESVLEVSCVGVGFLLVPGQTLPMTLFHPVFQTAIRRSVLGNRVFGVVGGVSGAEEVSGRGVSRGSLGTLAEIYEWQEEEEQREGRNFSLKAKGRDRFNVLEVRRQADGNLLAKIRIRPEIILSNPLLSVFSQSISRFLQPIKPIPAIQPTEVQESKEESGPDVESPSQNLEENIVCDTSVIRSASHLRRYYSRVSSWPEWVYDAYDPVLLVGQIHQKLHQDLGRLSHSQKHFPSDPTELSFWLAQNLTLDDSVRRNILRMDSPIMRLKYQIQLLQNANRVINCRRCMATIAEDSDIFAMSTEGPQGTYVNPNGFIHETITLLRVRDVIQRGHPSTQASWFQGYSWTIVECRGCSEHLGWKFVALERLKPRKFWGLTRKSLCFRYDFPREESNQSTLTINPQSPPLPTNATTTISIT